MAQFDVYANPSVHQRSAFPFVIQLQHDSFELLPTRMVMPLQRTRIAPNAFPRRLMASIKIEDESLYLAAHLTAPFPQRLLKHPVANIKDQQSVLRDALDAIQSGV